MSQSAMTQHTVTSRWSEFASSWWREATQNFRLGQSHVARHTTRSGSPTASVSVSLSTMNFFKSKQRTPPDLIRGLRDAIPRLESGAPGGETRRKVRQRSVEGCWTTCSSSYRPMKKFLRTYSRLKQYCMAMEVCTKSIWSYNLTHSASIRSSTRTCCPTCTRDIQHRFITSACSEYPTIWIRGSQGRGTDLQ